MSRSPIRIPPDRDLSIDFVRAICLPIVVLLHAFQMGIDGEPLRAFNALAEWKPLAGITWIGMIMPTFFIAGGFAGITTWRRLRHRGETAGEYIRVRALRLARPVLLAMVGVLVTIGAMAAFGADPEFLRSFAFRLAEPLWFIAVYAICTSCVPLMAWFHHRAAWATYFTLAALVVVIDLAGKYLGVPLGALNWLFLWLFVQQLGFGVRDQWYSRRPAWLLLALALVAYALIGVAVFGMGYDPDMIANLNPPTVVLLLLGLAQVYLFTLLQPAIRALMRRQAVLVTIGALGIYGMVVYLWHTVAMAVVVGVQLALGLPFPIVLSAEWWITRIPWLLAIFAVITVFCVIIPPIEKRWPAERPRIMPLWAAASCTLLLVAAVGCVLTQGYLTPWTVPAVCALAASIVWLTIGGPGAAQGERMLEDAGVRGVPRE